VGSGALCALLAENAELNVNDSRRREGIMLSGQASYYYVHQTRNTYLLGAQLSHPLAVALLDLGLGHIGLLRCGGREEAEEGHRECDCGSDGGAKARNGPDRDTSSDTGADGRGGEVTGEVDEGCSHAR
jgi:hypothetical protein